MESLHEWRLTKVWDFSDGPMVRSPHFHLKGHRFQRIVHTMECDQKKKKQFVLYNLIDKLKNRKNWDFPGDPVAKIQCYQCRGPKFDRSLVRELDPT